MTLSQQWRQFSFLFLLQTCMNAAQMHLKVPMQVDTSCEYQQLARWYTLSYIHLSYYRNKTCRSYKHLEDWLATVLNFSSFLDFYFYSHEKMWRCDLQGRSLCCRIKKKNQLIFKLKWFAFIFLILSFNLKMFLFKQHLLPCYIYKNVPTILLFELNLFLLNVFIRYRFRLCIASQQ